MAQPWNIQKFTEGRFAPRANELEGSVPPSVHEEHLGLPDVLPLRAAQMPAEATPTALLITEDDCTLEDFDLSNLELCASATLSSSHLRSTRPVAKAVTDFENAALKDTANRLALACTALRADDPSELVRWVRSAGAQQVAMPYMPTGSLHDWMSRAQPLFDAAEISVTELRRDWDMQIWPHATAGFFKVKNRCQKYYTQWVCYDGS